MRRIARVQHLLKIAGSDGFARDEDSELDLTLELLSVGREEASETVGFGSGGRILHPDDRVAFKATNRGRWPVYLTLLFVDSGYGIQSIFPRPGGELNRLEPGQHILTRATVNEKTLGPEQLVAIAVKAGPGRPVDLSYLEQPTLEQVTTRGSGRNPASPLARLLEQAMYGVGSLRGLTSADAGEYVTRILAWRVVPRSRDRGRSASSALVITPVQEAVLGEKALAEFMTERSLAVDTASFVRLSEIGRKVAKVSDRPDLPYRFLVVQGDELQAYAFPGGTICLTEALTRFYASDDELAFALGHEIAHVALRHHISRLKVGALEESGSPAARALLDKVRERFDRDSEVEADRFGALYAVRAGYRHSASHESLERLARTRQVTEDATHPDFPDRIRVLEEFRTELERALEAFARGVAALENEDPTLAISMFKLFVAEFPNSRAGRLNLGAAYLSRIRQAAGTPQDLAEVLPILPESTIRIRGGLDEIDLELARSNFEFAIELHADDELARGGLGLVYLRLGQHEKAREELNRALALDPTNHDLLLCMGNIDYAAGDYAAAAEHYREALTRRPESAGARHNLARVYEVTALTEQACALWTALTRDRTYGAEAERRAASLCVGGE